MKKVFVTIVILSVSLILHAQTENPFAKFGYDVLVASSSKGEFEEFHDQKDIVEIGSVLFDTRTNEIAKVLEKDETTIDISSATAAMSIDPHCEKYYWISPYAYVANNPLRFIDPDGRDIKIYYKDEDGKNRTWLFNGANQSEAPKNQFVQDFVTVYDYNVGNGGGDNLAAAATSTEYTLGLVQTDGSSKFSVHIPEKGRSQGVVRWNPTEGLETPKGTLSPAIMLEHETDHGVNWETKTGEHNKNKKIGDSHFTNKEEERVIKGSEYKTGVANGELKSIPKGGLNKNSNCRKHGGNENQSGQTHEKMLMPLQGTEWTIVK